MDNKIEPLYARQLKLFIPPSPPHNVDNTHRLGWGSICFVLQEPPSRPTQHCTRGVRGVLKFPKCSIF